jgi:hypothetical protein
MSHLDSVIKKLGFKSEQEIIAFKELLKLTGLNIIEEDQKSFEAALTHLVGLTQGTEDKPAWLRPKGKERSAQKDTSEMEKNRSKYIELFHQLGLFKEKGLCKDEGKGEGNVVLLFGAKQACVEGRLNYLQSLVKKGLNISKLVLLGGQRKLGEDENIHIQPTGEKAQTELEMMEALVYALVKNKQLDESIKIVPINALMEGDKKIPNTADTIKQWLEIDKELHPELHHNILGVSNEPHVSYQGAILKAVLDNNGLLGSSTVETVGGAMSKNEKIVTVLDALARFIYSSKDQLEKLFASEQEQEQEQEQASHRIEGKILST